MNVAILGCGPAGLLAAHAAKLDGHEVTIYSKDRTPSVVGGAQYIHRAIPMLNDPETPDGWIRYVKVGSQQTYAKKVYGYGRAATSWTVFKEGQEKAWMMNETYQKLWKLYESRIATLTVGPYELDHAVIPNHDRVISTIPAWALCHKKDEHEFSHVSVGFRRIEQDDKRPWRGENTIIYSGDPQDPWYRCSKLFGRMWYEYGAEHLSSCDFTGLKPIETDCDCFPDVVRAGRFGRWQKGQLVTDAFETARFALQGDPEEAA